MLKAAKQVNALVDGKCLRPALLPFPIVTIMSMYPGWSPSQQFQAWYAHHLATLTFNSRPIIDKLSMAALERKREGDWEGMSVVGEVLRHGIEVVSSSLIR